MASSHTRGQANADGPRTVLIAAGWLVVFCSPLRNVRHLDELGT
ncbi:hypothetical protein [Streptomyces fodineus]|nr:hypothetical protein [Streptomyces fodineus]